MSERAALAERLAALEAALSRLAARVAALEEGHAPAPAAAAGSAVADSVAAVEEETAAIAAAGWLGGLPSLVGRTFLVLGGAFLIRSLADSGVLSGPLAVGLGVTYALAWLLPADRAAAAGKHLSGAMHALASALVVYPLVVEAGTRLELLGPAAAAAVLAVATALGLFVAWRRAFRTVAWITLLGALGAGVLLLFRTRAILLFVGYLLALAVGSLVVAYGRGWRGQRWAVAVALDATVLLLGSLALVGEAPPDWLPALAVLVAQLGLVAIYLGAFVWRIAGQGRPVTVFAVMQTLVVLAAGFELALAVAGPAAAAWIAGGALAVGLLLHLELVRRRGAGRLSIASVGFLSAVATFLAAEGLRGLLPAVAYPLVWGLAGVALALFASGRRRVELQTQAAALVLAAALASGLLAAAAAALAAPATAAWGWPSPTALGVLLAAAAMTVLLYRSAAHAVPAAGAAGRLATAARVAALGVTLLGAAGLVVLAAAGRLAAAPGPGADAALLAVLRTAVLALAAVLLAAGRRALGRRELAGLAWAVLLAAGLKLVAEDVRLGSAGTLVLSLVLYGLALIAVPALARRPPAVETSDG